MALALLSLAATPAQGLPCGPETVEPERKFLGVFIDDFEDARFFEGARSVADVDRRARPRIWMDFDVVGLGRLLGVTRREQYSAYRVSFVGVRRSHDQGNPSCGYGHMNAYDVDMRVVRLLSIESLGPSSPPRQLR